MDKSELSESKSFIVKESVVINATQTIFVQNSAWDIHKTKEKKM